ncbi:hypothetical protein HanXRQr2_Chr01g0011511 [Helianthus annuus]|uniref:Uncharacterized protein n=1 Tax=Helianthus annuus TaxID=4232 RepID=A0A251VLQ4_HELAN|nr:hypothetical protein HanXRQr2_Chr01g0011511 [Helianthus annuus]
MSSTFSHHTDFTYLRLPPSSSAIIVTHHHPPFTTTNTTITVGHQPPSPSPILHFTVTYH